MKSQSREVVTQRLNKNRERDASGICRLIALMAGIPACPTSKLYRFTS
jgi:hypothetical protein